MNAKSFAPVALATFALVAPPIARAAEAGDVQLRGRVIGILPDESSGAVSGIADSAVGVDDAWTLEADITIFASPHWAFELIAATADHDIVGEGSIKGLGKIAEVSVLPPTLTLQYHFLPDGRVQPYLGVGVNYTAFYDEKATSALAAGTTVSLDDSWGWAAQFGMDFAVGDSGHWFVNFDVKYIDMDTTATLVDGGTVSTVDVDIDPWVPGVGIAYRW